ncbi:class I SAM-dependent RNA methyltransferase [Sphingomonas sp. LY29]|uniref:class I SAM-dependent RNA methyltransferase n=1 Tax=Sphingomonas sp. LY29 TaxID=3095341 RepID=UPI002D7903E9|nr:class I SAM-dependent RNA methyltransferase [Sphingomonas sp. LY29]WRP26101.1 class I SAM-dependent RNA methyltransferase [Sphingomonas sp. LY29]
MSDPVIRIAARGDGVTAAGKHVAFGVPGDVVLDDGTLQQGPGHQVPPCRHFPICGGCQLQHLTDAAYADYCRSRVVGALAQHGIETEVREPHLSPPRSRRRATLRALSLGKGIAIGFNEAGSNRVVDLRECHVLRPELFALVEPLRRLFKTILPAKRSGEIQMSLTQDGVDLSLKGVQIVGLAAIEGLTEFAKTHGLARLSVDEGYGPETRYEPKPTSVSLSGTRVALPTGAFLQATEDGERALVEAVLEATAGAARTADLFAGLGTFALAMPGEVMAAEAARDPILALKAAAPRVKAEHRDLYRRPYEADELADFDAVVLDPPRSGAFEQIARLAESSVPRIAYVSCNPATFARDAEKLVEGGYRLAWVRPVGQFRWSTHVELAAAFTR